MAWAGTARNAPVQTNAAARSARSAHQPFSIDVDLVAADTSTLTLLTVLANHTIIVTKIMVSVITDAAQSVSVQDSAGTPVIIAKTKASPGLGPITFDFGEDGTRLTEATNLVANLSGAGLAARIHVEGYQKRTVVAAA